MNTVLKWLKVEELRNGNTTATGRLDRLFSFSFFGLACKNTTADCDELGAKATALAGLGSRSCCCARKRESCDEMK